MLCTTCGRAIRSNGTVQRILDHGIAQRVLHLSDLQRTQRQLIHIGRRNIQGIAGVTRCHIVLAVNNSTIGIGGKVPGARRSATPIVIGVEFPLKDCAGKGTITLGIGGILIHLSQHKGRIEDRNIGYRDHILTRGYGMGIAFGVQLIAGRGFGFLDGQHITNVVLLGRCCIAVGIGNQSFHHLTVQGDGILRTCQGIQRVALDLIDTGLGGIDGLLQGNRLGVFCVGQGHSSILSTNGHFLHFHLTSGVHIDFIAFRGFGFLHEVSATIQASPLTLTIGIGLTNAGAHITGVGSRQNRIVCTGNGSRTCRVTVQGELCTCQVGSTCGIGFGQADRAGALAIGSPVAT